MISARERRRRMEYYDNLEKVEDVEHYIVGPTGTRIPIDDVQRMSAGRMKRWAPHEPYQGVISPPPSKDGG
jgi:hypothetical protein